MLFDLRGRGRRRTIQVIYLTLAVLMGGGLVFFGIGGNASGGLFDAIGLTGGGNSGGGGGSDILKKQERSAEKRVSANPRDAAAWAALARARYQQAGQGTNYNQRNGVFTAAGRRQLAQATRAWERYLALNPPKPDDTLASLMVQAYGPAGLNRPGSGVAAAEIVTSARPSATTYYQLALFAYSAGQKRKADLAAAKAIQLTPASSRAQVKQQLEQVKKQAAAGPAGAAATGGAAPTPTPATTG